MRGPVRPFITASPSSREVRFCFSLAYGYQFGVEKEGPYRRVLFSVRYLQFHQKPHLAKGERGLSMFELHINIDKGKLAAFAVGAVVAGLLLGVGVAYATDDAYIIHACVDGKGKVTIVGSAEDCKEKEIPLEWNIVGPGGADGAVGVAGVDGTDGADGAAGADGDDGAAGADGAQGPAGVFGYEAVVGTLSVTDLPSGAVVVVEAFCPAGKNVLGGGGLALGTNSFSFDMFQEFPPNTTNPTSWRALFTNTSNIAQSADLQAIAMCAILS